MLTSAVKIDVVWLTKAAVSVKNLLNKQKSSGFNVNKISKYPV